MKNITYRGIREAEIQARKLNRIRARSFCGQNRPIGNLTRGTIERRLEKLFDMAFQKIGTADAELWLTTEPVSFRRKEVGEYKRLVLGTPWANKVFDCAWMHVFGKMPSGNGEEVAMLVDIGGEGLVYDSAGHPKQGITTFCSQFSYDLGLPYKKYVCLTGLNDGENIDFYIDAAANDLFGNFLQKCVASQLDIVIVHKEIRGLYYDLNVLMQVYDSNPESEYTRKIYKAVLDVLSKARGLTNTKARILRKQISSLLAEKSRDNMTFYATGHAHIDLAWLWPLRETVRKGGRTVASQLMNLERYSDAVFGLGQAQLYDWIKAFYPELFEKIKEKHREGRWEIQGAPWVESDTNLISGESMIRQFYYGKKFYMENFGEDVKMQWLPDTFGHSACMPMVMKLAGIDYFMTSRPWYNQADKFPSTFRWFGLDGSEVITHITPEGFYNSPGGPLYINRGKHYYTEGEIGNKAVTLFGIGDGGGGPGFEHYERLMREKDLRGVPKVEQRKVIDFFHAIEHDAPMKERHGELYLEQFRGTYTTHSKVKFYNRKMEIFLRNYEMLACLANARGIQLPISFEKLEIIWNEVLLYQFHDILPGSAINRVYDECEARYAILHEQLTSAIKSLCTKLGANVVNLNPFAYDKPIKFKNKWYLQRVPALGTARLSSKNLMSSFCGRIGSNSLENDLIKVTFKDGYICSIYDKTRRLEVIPEGKLAGVLNFHADIGNCWTILPRDYSKSLKGRARVVCDKYYTDGPEAIAEFSYVYHKTTVRAVYKLIDGQRMINVDLDIGFGEKNTIMRMNFPTVLNPDMANYNIQYGHIARSTGDNTPIEKSMFEVSAHKFVDITENGFGVSLLSESKYGFRCKGGELSMSLLRSPLAGPSHNVDAGNHRISYGILLHCGNLGEETYKEAIEFNNKPIVQDVQGASDSMYQSDNMSVILDTVQHMDGKHFAVRFYNSTDKEQTANVDIAGATPLAYADIFGKKIAKCTGAITLKPFGLCNILFKVDK